MRQIMKEGERIRCAQKSITMRLWDEIFDALLPPLVCRFFVLQGVAKYLVIREECGLFERSMFRMTSLSPGLHQQMHFKVFGCKIIPTLNVFFLLK